VWSVKGATIEVPQALKRLGQRRDFSLPSGEGSGQGLCPFPENISNVMVHSGMQFLGLTVHFLLL